MESWKKIATVPCAGRTVLLVVLLALTASFAMAKGKPPKPPPPPPAPADTGLIYLVDANGSLHSMETDGTDRIPVVWGGTGVRSDALHGGRRWFLQFREIPGEWYPTPDGAQPTDTWNRYELWVVPEFDGAGDESDAKQLTFDPSVQPNRLEDGDAGYAQPKWAVDDGEVDGKVSYVALRWDANGEVVDHGIHQVYLEWSTMTATPAAAMIPVGPHILAPALGTRWIRGEHDWNPDGDAVAYRSGSTLRRIDAVDGWSTPDVLASGAIGYPRWSPDGTRIAFHAVNFPQPISSEDSWKSDVETVGSDGSGRRVLAEHTRTSGVWMPRWSPSGSHLVYNQKKKKKGRYIEYEFDIYRITKDGGDSTNLTADSPLDWYVVGWLAD